MLLSDASLAEEQLDGSPRYPSVFANPDEYAELALVCVAQTP